MNIKPSRRRLTTAAGVCLLGILPGIAFAAQESAEHGRRLARQWCVECHSVEPGNTASDAAPTFPQIARNRELTPDLLRGWLSDPHPPMPNLSLSRAEIEALVAYLGSLGQP